MHQLSVLFGVVFLLNLIPAFAPPTWMVFSFLGFRFSGEIGWAFALVGALAATLGRALLARMSRVLIRNRLLSERARANVDAIRSRLEGRPTLTFGMFLFYAFTPLPSNYLFIAYGLTTLRLALIAVPFFLGRFASYSFWIAGGAAAARRLDVEESETLSYLGVYFIASQLALLALVYVFTRIDWRVLLYEGRLRWLARPAEPTPKP